MSGSAESNITSRKERDAGIVNSFADGLTESISQPFSQAADLFCGPRSKTYAASASSENQADSTSDNIARQAGNFVGSAATFIATAALARRLFPGAGRVAPVIAGAGLGFLSPTEHNTLSERVEHSLLGAGTVSLLEFAPGALNRFGIAKGTMSQLAVSGGLAGAFQVQGESLLRTGQLAGPQDTLLGVGTWAATGLAFGGAGKFATRFGELGKNNRSVKTLVEQPGPSAELGAEYRRHFVDLPGLEVGMPARVGAKLNVGAGSDLAKMYETAQESVGRAEVLASERDGMSGRHGTVFGATSDGKLLTANHVVDNAVDVTVFDRFERPHAASVIAVNQPRDLAVLQLREPSSYGAFKPLPLAQTAEQATQGEGLYAAFGHPNGWRDLHAAPGTPARSFQPLVKSHFTMHGEESFSGAPIIHDGVVKAVLVQGPRSNRFEVIGTPAHHAAELIASTSAMSAAEVAPKKFDLQLIRSFKIHDTDAASTNLSKIFGDALTDERPAEFFHSKLKTVPMPGTEPGALTMKVQYLPTEQQIVIKPIALDGKAIGSDALWPNTKLRIDQSRITLGLTPEGVPQSMTSYNDPTGVLQKAFNFRGENNYLADLTQQPNAPWMNLLPPALRYRM